jgi:AraC-like DNA-binding protein
VVVIEGTVSTATVRFVLAGLQTLGADPGALARRAGLPLWALGDNTARVSGAQMASLMRLSRAQLADPRLACQLGCQWRYGALHLYDYLFGTAATLGEALEVVGRRYPGLLVGSRGAVGLVEQDDRVTVVWQAHQGADPDIQVIMSEIGVGRLLTQVRQLLERNVTPVHVGLTAAAPAGHRNLAEILGVPHIEFGADQSTISFSRADISSPMANADPRLAFVLRRHAETLIASPGITLEWIDRFRRVLASHLAAPDLSLRTVAAGLGMSPRTLQRRLEREGTSWRQETDVLRREQAGRLELDGLSRAAAAARLGYSDARALRRAASRWDADGSRRDH